MSQPLPCSRVLLLTLAKVVPQKNILVPRSPVATHLLYCPVTLYNTGDMAVTIEMQNTGDSRARREILAGVEHVLSDVAGEWRVSIVGSRADDN